MKRKNSNLGDEESRLSQLLFKKSNNLVEKLKSEEFQNVDVDQKPAWIDEDETEYGVNIITNTKRTGSYAEKLKQKYEILMGTPKWAKLNERIKTENIEDDEILRTVGHLKKTKPTSLPKTHLEMKRFPKINSSTKNEGSIISCIEFHPKISAALVAGNSGVVSLFSIGGDVNNKLHSFRLKSWKITATQFTPDGTEAYISSNIKHSYCIHNLARAESAFVQLPRVVKTAKIFQLSPNGKYIAASNGLDEVYIIYAASKELLRSLKNNTNIQSVTFSHDSEQLYTYGIEGEVTVWDLSTYRAVKKFYDHGCITASCITTSSCGRLLATGSGQGIVNIYETSNLTTSEPTPLKIISNLSTVITKIRFNSTTEILATSSANYPNAVKLVHIPSYHVFSNFPDQSTNLYLVDTVSFSPNSGYMALGNNKGCAYLYRLKYYKNY